MASKPKKRPNDSVDCDSARRGIWLVKIPRYLSECWERNAGQEVAKMVIDGVSGKPQVKLVTSKTTSATSPSNSHSIPLEHSVIFNDVKRQKMAVICEDKTSLCEDASICSGDLKICGRVVRRADCRPPSDKGYLRMKIRQIQERSQPKRQLLRIDKAEVKFKPVSSHQELIVRDKQKKEGMKAVRLEKDHVLRMLFHAFEKHQYYRLIDLQKLTNQPPGYLKEILFEIAAYNSVPPHKAMWELKPEYRSYSSKKD